MLSAGMLTDFASATMVRSRGLLSMSPPPARAATVSSLMMRVNTLPRLASAAPFLCLMVCHLEWPDMFRSPDLLRKKPPDDRSCYHESPHPPPGRGFAVRGFAIRDSGFGIRDSGFGIGIRDSGFGIPDEGSGIR